MRQNKTGKYFKYAVGEIILVVIGILIALQINTWNENRKLRNEELKILQNFKKSLLTDAAYRKESTAVYNATRNSIDYLIDYMEKDLPYKDSLKYHFEKMTSDWGLQYDFSTYEVLKSKDLGVISNESLRSNIISYYTYAEGLGSGLTQRYTEVLEDASKTLFSKHFDQMWSGRPDLNGVMIPVNYESLKHDHQFRYFLKTLKNQNFWLIERTTIISEDLYTKIADEIDLEIERLSNK